MNTIRLVGIGVLLLALAFAGGYWAGHGDREIQTVVQEKRIEVAGRERVVIRDRIVTVTRTVQPDGTVTETTRTEEKSKEKEKESEQVATETKEASKVGPGASHYSLGLLYRPAFGTALGRPDFSQVGIEAGVRVLGPAWIQLGIDGRREVTLGVRVEL